MQSYAASALILPQPSPYYALLCHIYRGVAGGIARLEMCVIGGWRCGRGDSRKKGHLVVGSFREGVSSLFVVWVKDSFVGVAIAQPPPLLW